MFVTVNAGNRLAKINQVRRSNAVLTLATVCLCVKLLYILLLTNTLTHLYTYMINQ